MQAETIEVLVEAWRGHAAMARYYADNEEPYARDAGREAGRKMQRIERVLHAEGAPTLAELLQRELGDAVRKLVAPEPVPDIAR